MPMIVDPRAPQIPVPVRVTSADGYLTAVVDATYAGVLLIADRSTTTPEVPQWSLVRIDPDGSRFPVRSGNPLWSPGGYGLAYDHEPPLGVPVQYEATPLSGDHPASVVVVTIPAPDKPKDVWVKSTEDPGLSLRVHVESWPELVYEARQELAQIPETPYPVTVSDVYSAPTATATIYTDDQAEADAFRALSTSAHVLLLSTRPEYDRADSFVVLGNVSEAVIAPGHPARRWTVDLQPVARPDTAGQATRMPGWNADDLPERWSSWSALAASYSTMAALATNGLA